MTTKKRSKKAPTFSVRCHGKTQLTTPNRALADLVCRQFFSEQRSVSIFSNAERKTVAHYIYGHKQPSRS